MQSLSVLVDVALVLVAVLAVFSLLVTALNEFLAAFFNLRGVMLVEALRRLWGSRAKADQFLGHGLITSLQKQYKFLMFPDKHRVSKWRFPSYLDSNRFVQVLVAKAREIGPEDAPDWDAALGEASPELAEQIKALWKYADKDYGRFEELLVQWYDGYMQRVSGWYRRRVLFISMGIGLMLAVTFHIDPIRITRQLMTNPARAEEASQRVDSLLRQVSAMNTQVEALDTLMAPFRTEWPVVGSDNGLGATEEAEGPKNEVENGALAPPSDSSASRNASTLTQAIGKQMSAELQLIQLAAHQLTALLEQGVPIGWSNVCPCNVAEAAQDYLDPLNARANAYAEALAQQSAFWNTQVRGPGTRAPNGTVATDGVCEPFSGWSIAGWCLTALLTSLGAPFWFVQLQRLMRLRATGPSPTPNRPILPS